ncbi:MAG: hypothetical protein STSR0008_15630 [Ignavibacterium sp.]
MEKEISPDKNNKAPSINTNLENKNDLTDISFINSFLEPPGTKPLVVIDNQGNILFSNKSFFYSFNISIGENIKNIHSEPDLKELLEQFSKSDYINFKFDSLNKFEVSIKNTGLWESSGIAIPTERDIPMEKNFINYELEIDRIFINNNEFYILIFSSTKEKEQLENRINNLHNAIDYGKAAVIITDDKGIINYSSRSFEEIIGKRIDYIFNTKIHKVLQPFLNENEIGNLLHAIQKKIHWSKLIQGTDKEGKVWFREIVLNPIKRFDFAEQYNNDNVNFILTTHDITNYILSNQLIKRSEQKQKSIINNISDLLLIVRKEKNKLIFESANDNFYDIFKLNKNEIDNKNLNLVLPISLFNIIYSKILSINMPMEYNSEENNIASFRFFHPENGKEYTGKISYTDDPYDQQIKLFIISLTDITDQIETENKIRRAYEKENQLNKLKSAFLTNMSHEIRTPATAILGFSNLISEDIESSDFDNVVDMTKYLKDAINRLMNLIENIIEVSELEAGEYDFQITIFNVNELLEENFIKLHQLFQKSNIKMDLQLADESAFIKIDETKFSKILEVLITNAVKYNVENGNVLVKEILLDNYVEIHIIDTGKGIEKSKLELILLPFVQEEDDAHHRSFEGAGLGLTIASKLVQAFMGTMIIESEKGIGTTVKIRLPRVFPS